MRRVQYSSIGGPEVLEVVEVENPHPGPGEVRVRVRAAGLNPLDTKLFRGAPTASGTKPALPSGNGHDFAGDIDELGEGVTQWQLGDAVYGQVPSRAQADFVIVAADQLSLKPADLPYEVAGSLSIAGRTAFNSVSSLNLGPDDTVFVSAAAGGVGALAAQLALRTGAKVIGSASAANHDFLRSLGVVPVAYGDGLTDAHITAALDNHGRESVDAALPAGAPAGRGNSIAHYTAAEKYGTTAVGGRAFDREGLDEVAKLIAAGDVQFPIESVFALEAVGEAYARLLGSHGPGKIVLALD
ncbi:MAG: NADP-dependent oxidoreductase [Actinobacteria bacterium]|nr:NADP-dependent oxidoreductase [Actinomycetota bacterium]